MYQFLSKYLVFFIAIFLLVVLFVLLLIGFTGGKQPGQQISSMQDVSLDAKPSTDLTKIPGFINKQQLAEDTLRYDYRSQIAIRPNEIITKNGIPTFKKVLIPEDKNSPEYVTISEVQQMYGFPEKIMKGSKFYGDLLKTYIYASKGVAFIGNEFTDEVFEAHYFSPTTVDSYIQNYGDDVILNKTPETHP